MKLLIKKSKFLILPLFGLYVIILVRTAWVSDDGFITFRSIENVFHGYGLVFNVGERVQTFTHPLWLFLQYLTYLITQYLGSPFGLNKLYFGNIIISVSISIVAISLYSFKVARSTQLAVLGLGILTLSKGYMDYSTSGLENPLSHFLALCFFGLYLSKARNHLQHITALSILASLAMLNRLDTILLYGPALALIVWQSSSKPKAIYSILIGLLPIALWEIFSLFYYGTLFPNTAVAKLNTGIESITLFRQGVYYFLNSLRLDSITLVFITLSIVLALISRDVRRISLAVGISFYLFYILYIGGDFMSGRYFSLPLIIGVISLSTFDIKRPIIYASIFFFIVVIGLLPFILTIERRPTYGLNRENNLVFFDNHKIADERLVHRDRTGLLTAIEGNSPRVVYSQDDWLLSGSFPINVHIVGAMGINGYRDGPNIHVVDVNGLADPLVARMPLNNLERWRIGHFHHIIPDGYIDTLSSGINMIKDPNIALYYDKLSIAFKGPLWNWNRFVEIWYLNTGKYNYLIEK